MGKLIETIDDLPGEGEDVLVYYFGDRPKEGAMETGTCTVMLDGESYLISAAGKIMKGRTNVKDADGYYYCTDKKGVVTYYGEERYKKQ